MNQIKAIVKAAEIAGVEHYVWSTLESTKKFFDGLPEAERPVKIGEYYTPHFDGKAIAKSFFPKEKTTLLYVPAYAENIWVFGAINQGTATLNMGDSELPVMSIDDIGYCVHNVFLKDMKGQSVYVASERLTFQEWMKVCSEATGKEYVYEAIDYKTMMNAGVPGAHILANLYAYLGGSKPYWKNFDPASAKELHPGMMSIRDAMVLHKDELQPSSSSQRARNHVLA